MNFGRKFSTIRWHVIALFIIHKYFSELKLQSWQVAHMHKADVCILQTKDNPLCWLHYTIYKITPVMNKTNEENTKQNEIGIPKTELN